ncbi:uncharacterized protein [Nicotiana tomentosiformis]|uniref:uncharacterized protein n=1 Tax=Nicotiana tomentosiformis TaxID=4098 RepID=UPI00388CDDB2
MVAGSIGFLPANGSSVKLVTSSSIGTNSQSTNLKTTLAGSQNSISNLAKPFSETKRILKEGSEGCKRQSSCAILCDSVRPRLDRKECDDIVYKAVANNGITVLTLKQADKYMLNKYIPPSQREELRGQFEHLEQGQMSVTDYEARFSGLSRHTLITLLTDVERVRRFVAGLHPGIQASMAREVEMGTDYKLVVEISRRIEGYHQRGREQMQQEKRTHFFGEFRGAPARGRGKFGRGQPSKPTYPAPTPSLGAPARPYFSAMPESSYRPPVHQGSSSAYFSAMPESSYRPPAIHCYSSGYSGHQGQTLGQQSMVPRGCYECGDPGHMKRACPRLWGKAVQQGHQPMIAAPVVRLLRGGGTGG